MYDCRPSNMYVVRAWFKRHYLLKLFSILIFWLFACTLCFRIAEYRYNIHVESLWNAFWLTFSTMFCLGFGDVFPQTKFGRCIAFVTMYTGVVFTYFSITLIKRILKLNSSKYKVTLRWKKDASFDQWSKKEKLTSDLSFRILEVKFTKDLEKLQEQGFWPWSPLNDSLDPSKKANASKETRNS